MSEGLVELCIGFAFICGLLTGISMTKYNKRKAQPEPFGIWHQGDTSEESDFFLYADAGDVACDACVKLYTEPPKKEWVGLTDREISEAWFTGEPYDKVVRMLEAKLKEKNT